MKEGTSMLEHLNFFNKIIHELTAVDIKINEEDKVLILLSSLTELYDHIITTMLYGKKTLILEEVTSTLLCNEIKERPNHVEREGSVWWSWEGNEKKERKVRDRRSRVTFVNRKVTRRKTVSIGQSG